MLSGSRRHARYRTAAGRSVPPLAQRPAGGHPGSGGGGGAPQRTGRRALGSGPRYMIRVTLFFCTLRESENSRTCENCTRFEKIHG